MPDCHRGCDQLRLQRVQAGTPLAANTTPHNEYLYVAVQCGVLGLALLIWLMAAPLSHALRAGCSGIPSLLVWVSIGYTGLFNAVLRDARLALPLLLLAAIAAAVQGRNEPSPKRSPKHLP